MVYGLWFMVVVLLIGVDEMEMGDDFSEDEEHCRYYIPRPESLDMEDTTSYTSSWDY